MKQLQKHLYRVSCVAAVAALTMGCGGSDDPAVVGTGGVAGMGGGIASGGAVGAGGIVGAGGVTGTGGAGAGGGPVATGGFVGTGGFPTTSTGGVSGSGGVSATGGATGTGGATATGGASGTGGGVSGLAKFSFFVTSLKAMQREANNPSGFGGKLTFGETGAGAGLRGADKLCTKIAETSMPGSGAKVWHAFLSATTDGNGSGAVNAIDRVGNGPWYDRLGRMVSDTKANLGKTRPTGGDATIANDLPNEDGVPNHQPDTTQGQVDNHDVLTGSSTSGTLYVGGAPSTCNDWTSDVGTTGKPRVGHSWPRSGRGGPGGMENWMSALDEAGCAPGVNIVEMGPPNPTNPTVGSGGGYGGIYCFAMTP